MSETLSIEQLRDLIHKGEAKDPLVFLESVMNGQDPRKQSDLYTLAIDIDEFSDGVPDADDWALIYDMIRMHFKYQSVSLSESTSAAKTISEYLHAKRKQIETKESGAMAEVQPLKKAEIKAFLKIYEGEF